MASPRQNLIDACADLPDDFVRAHVDRLPDDYLERFSVEEAALHARALQSLGRDRPAAVFVSGSGVETGVTVIGRDRPFAFALITGVLAAEGFNITRGEVYTLTPPADAGADRNGATAAVSPPRQIGPNLPPTASRYRRRLVTAIDQHAGRRRADTAAAAGDGIIDILRGTVDRSATQGGIDAWAQRVRDAMTDVLGALGEGDEAAVRQAKRLVNERVTARLASLPVRADPVLFPVSVRLASLEGNRLRLVLAAQDTPAFLYALSSGLSMQGLSIDRVVISPDDPEAPPGLITDQIDLVLPPGRAADDPALLERIKLTSLLTKQFTYFLARAPDPYAAMERFERLAVDLLDTATTDREDLARLLADPRAMRDLARLLGASDFLWEDFIRGQHESLTPILDRAARDREDHSYAEPIETLPHRLWTYLDGAVGLAEQKDRLNRFKDQELFKLDLDHILNPSVNFRLFSERLTLLAESLIAAAARLVYDDLVRSHGEPGRGRRGDVTKPPYAVFGLGKLGGVALGYASDVELLFLYDAPPTGRTAGGKRKPVTNAEFFETFAREAAGFIRSKRAGIFEIDLRLRPYGSEGPLAHTVDAFEAYYRRGGPAHLFERLALVRLRWVAGNPALGSAVERLRDTFVYDDPLSAEDLDELWDVLERVKQEKVGEHDRPNAKYSPGALVDLEASIQLLQVRHAPQAPQLRTPRLSQAIDALQRAEALAPADYAALRAAYEFYRRLINALRMLRGDAQDLFLPPAESLEMTHLARRVGVVGDPRGTDEAAALEKIFAGHTQAVRGFITRQFGRDAPGAGDRPG